MIQRFLTFAVIAFLILLGSPRQAFAFEVKHAETVRIEKDQVIDGSLIAGGTSIVVEGRVKGDVYCAGEQVTISGVVDGDVICAGQSLDIKGQVTGSIRLVGQHIDVSGLVKRNATVAAQSFTLLPGGVIEGEILAAGASLLVDGKVGKAVMAASQKAMINGLVSGGLNLAVEELSIGERATVSGAIRYISENEAKISTSASVMSGMVRTIPKKDDTAKETREENAKTELQWPANAWTSILFYLLVGLMVVAVFPRYTARVVESMTKSPVASGFIGALVLMITPAVAFFLFITILGIPVSFLLTLLYIVGIAVCRIFVAVIVGAYLLDKFDIQKKTNPLIQIIIGVPVLWIIFKAPFIGGLVGFIAICWGLGGMFTGLKAPKK